MRHGRSFETTLLLSALILVTGCERVSHEDFKVYGDVAYIDKRITDYDSTYLLSWQIVRHLVAAMKVLEDNPDLRALHTVVFTYDGEMEDKYGNWRVETWPRVSVPVDEWFKYTEEIRRDTHEVRKRVLAEWIVEGVPYSEGLARELAN